MLWTGCSVSVPYIATPTILPQVTSLPPEEQERTAKDLKPVYVRASALMPALQLQPGAASSAGPVLLPTRRYSPMVTAGVVLTSIGSALSVAGTVLFFANGGAYRSAGGPVALSGEPPMILGTVLWIMGIMRPPQEVPAGRPSLHYLNSN
jgi:hypothetical protein